MPKTTPLMAHRPPSESDSRAIHLESKPELRQPLVVLWQQPEILPSSSFNKDSENGELFLLFNVQNFCSCVITGWHISRAKYLMRKFLFIFQRNNEMRRGLQVTWDWQSGRTHKNTDFFSTWRSLRTAKGISSWYRRHQHDIWPNSLFRIVLGFSFGCRKTRLEDVCSHYYGASSPYYIFVLHCLFL